MEGWRWRTQKSPARREPSRGLSENARPFSLAAADLPWRCRLAAAALGRLRLDLQRLVVFFRAASEPLRRGPQTSTDTFGLRLLLCRIGFLVRLGLRVVLAADELDLSDFGAVAPAVAEPEQTGIAARPIREARRQGVEQLADDIAVLQVLHDEA